MKYLSNNQALESPKALLEAMKVEVVLTLLFLKAQVMFWTTNMPTSLGKIWDSIVYADCASGYFSTGRQGQRGQVSISDLMVVAIFIVVIAIVAGMGSKILAGMKVGETDIAVNNTLDKGINALGVIGDWLDDITTVYVAVVIITLLVGILAVVAVVRGGTGGEQAL